MRMINTAYPVVNESFFIEASRITVYSRDFWVVVLEGVAFLVFLRGCDLDREMPLIRHSQEESFGLVDSGSQQIYIFLILDV